MQHLITPVTPPFCNCRYCKHTAYNTRTKKRFSKGRNKFRNSVHRQWIKRIRNLPITSDVYTPLPPVGYTD